MVFSLLNYVVVTLTYIVIVVFTEILLLFYNKLMEKFQVLLKSDKNKIYCTMNIVYIYDISLNSS